LAVGHIGQASEHVTQVSKGIKAATPAAFNQGINDGAALARIRFTDEEPVFLADGRGPNGVFHIKDRYEEIDYDDLDDKQKQMISSLILKDFFINEIQKGPDLDIAIIKFILRRMGQLGDDSLVATIISNLELIHHAYADVVRYFQNLRHLIPPRRYKLGSALIELINNSMMSELSYYRMWTFSMFSHSTEWNNAQQFQTLMNASKDQFSRRELILAMGRAKQSHWFQSQWRHLFDEPPWTRRALLAAASCMAGDASTHWYRSVSPRLDILEKAVVKWAKKNPFA
jgi:hypothetical protein